MNYYARSLVLVAALALLQPVARAEGPISNEALVDALVRQAAFRMNLPAAAKPRAATEVRTSKFSSTSTGGSLAEALGMRANEERPAQGPTALHQLRDLKFRRGRKVRQQREKLYREALQELMTEFQRATQVPHEDVAELSKLTGHRTSSIRRDLFRTQITAPAEEPSSD